MPLKRSEEIIVVIVRMCKDHKLDNDNAAVVIDQERNPKGTQVFGTISRKLRHLNFAKIVPIDHEVL